MVEVLLAVAVVGALVYAFSSRHKDGGVWFSFGDGDGGD